MVNDNFIGEYNSINCPEEKEAFELIKKELIEKM